MRGKPGSPIPVEMRSSYTPAENTLHHPLKCFHFKFCGLAQGKHFSWLLRKAIKT